MNDFQDYLKIRYNIYTLFPDLHIYYITSTCKVWCKKNLIGLFGSSHEYVVTIFKTMIVQFLSHQTLYYTSMQIPDIFTIYLCTYLCELWKVKSKWNKFHLNNFRRTMVNKTMQSNFERKNLLPKMKSEYYMRHTNFF